jgi:psp operon transcriptional activator
VIAATNVDLPSAIAEGQFRADLLDRLAFEVLTVPPLRARPDDIPLLARAFGHDMASELGRAPFAGFAESAIDRLLAHSWPGNVRELKNVAERSVFRAERLDRPVREVVLDPFDSPWRAPSPQALPAAVPSPSAPQAAPGPIDLDRHLAEEERRLIEGALDRHRHNRRRAAAALGLSYDQLRARLRRLAIDAAA